MHPRPDLSLGRRRYKTVPGTHYGTPKELWGFRTPPARRSPELVARDFLSQNADLLGVRGLRLRRRRVIQSLGAHHVIFSQALRGALIHRAYVTVHLDRDRRVYLVKNRAVPLEVLERTRPPRPMSLERAVRRGRAVLAGRKVTLQLLNVALCWFPRGRALLPAYRLQFHRKTPRTRSEEILFLHAATGTLLSRYDNLAARSVRARLFDPNPLARVDWEGLALPPGADGDRLRRARRPGPDAYVEVTLRGLPRTGLLDGPRVSTRLTSHRTRVRRSFREASDQPAFEEVMAWYHLDAVARYIEGLGYRGTRRIFRSALLANARGSREDNAWYSPGLRSITFGTGGVDGAEDGETIVHEFGHALQDAICPGFGQSSQAAAMGEGFGDYLAGSYFADRKPAPLRDGVMGWDAFEDSEEIPPCLRRLDSPLTFESFDHSSRGDEHDNGMIWSATLWEIRRALGQQAADRIIVESHFQLDAFTTFARGARAILDADRNLRGGRGGAVLRRIFRRRGIGPVD